MHRAHVIHRDIKLQNFMLDQNNDIIIIDFGLSNCLDEKGFLTTQCGSPAFVSFFCFTEKSSENNVLFV